MIEKTLQILRKHFQITEKNAGDYAVQKVNGMTFRIRAYEIIGIGHLSLMQADGMFGLMKMDTAILTPVYKDAPLFSYDRIKALGNDTFILEFYNTMLDESVGNYINYMNALERAKEQVSDIPEHDLGKHWYDSIKLAASSSKKTRKCGARLDEQYQRVLGIYMEMLKCAPDVEPTAKTAKSYAYVDGLFTNGGPSTDAFVKAIGVQRAREMFETIIFGVR